MPSSRSWPVRAQVGERALGGHELVVAVDLGADEAPRDVGVDGAGGVLGAGAGRDRPRAHLVLAHREERDQAEQRVAVAQHAVDRRLGQPEVGQERLLLLARELGDLRLDHRRDPADARLRARRHLGEPEALAPRARPSAIAFSSRFRQCRIGFCERKVKPRRTPRLVRRRAPPRGAASPPRARA